MKAIVYEHYGSPEVLQLKELPRPEPQGDEVLVKIRAASVNSWDWDQLRGKPFIIRMIGGLWRPRIPILGMDIAGEVVAIGEKVTHFRVGDAVFGDISAHGWGGFAEYVAVSQEPLARIPAGISFADAAALPQAGVLALQGLRYGRGLRKGDKLLINGAGGGVGPIAIQLAKLWGAEVTAVDRSDKFDFLRQLGADHVIDHQRTDYTKRSERYDFILDLMAFKRSWDYFRPLKKDGLFVVVGGAIPLIFSVFLLGKVARWFMDKTLGVLAHVPKRKDLEELANYCLSGQLKPIIDEVYPLEEVPTAMHKIGSGNMKGKIIIQN